jgi:hypothetical protein
VPDAVPTVPTGLTASAISGSSTLLSWDAASVPGGGFVTGYAIFENDHQIATTTGTTYAASNLMADTTYTFAVAALDAAGLSAETSPISVHTLSVSPSVPGTGGNLAAEFSPYIDMAMPQDANLSAISAASGIHNFTLAFMLSSGTGIGWQGAGTVSDDTLSNGTTILSQVQAIQAAGGDVSISFGGAAGQEAALTATSATSLQAEYQSVIDRYHVHSLDFDIEGAAVQDQHSITLRDQALAGLEAANPDLVISYTLPVLPSGLTAEGVNVLASAKNDGLKIDVVNIMTMDYGSSVDNGGQMGLDAINAAIATEKQIVDLGLSSKVGITPMIGVNDISSEVFTLADAQALVNYAQTDPNVVRLSMWSVARDNGNSAGAHYASPDSSGLAQQPYDFSAIFHQFDHTAQATASTVSADVIDPPGAGLPATPQQSVVSSGGSVELAAGASSDISFAGSTGTLTLHDSLDFTGIISGFTGDGTLAGSDHIDLTDVSYSGLEQIIDSNTVALPSYTDGVLTVSDGTHTANLHFDGAYQLTNFKFADDGNGGTIVYDPPAIPNTNAQTTSEQVVTASLQSQPATDATTSRINNPSASTANAHAQASIDASASTANGPSHSQPTTNASASIVSASSHPQTATDASASSVTPSQPQPATGASASTVDASAHSQPATDALHETVSTPAPSHPAADALWHPFG